MIYSSAENNVET